MHLKHCSIRFGCINKFVSCIRLVRFVSKFSTCSGLGWVGLGWVSQLMSWIGSGHTKWTHGQLWFSVKYRDYVVAIRPFS